MSFPKSRSDDELTNTTKNALRKPSWNENLIAREKRLARAIEDRALVIVLTKKSFKSKPASLCANVITIQTLMTSKEIEPIKTE